MAFLWQLNQKVKLPHTTRLSKYYGHFMFAEMFFDQLQTSYVTV